MDYHEIHGLQRTHLEDLVVHLTFVQSCHQAENYSSLFKLSLVQSPAAQLHFTWIFKVNGARPYRLYSDAIMVINLIFWAKHEINQSKSHHLLPPRHTAFLTSAAEIKHSSLHQDNAALFIDSLFKSPDTPTGLKVFGENRQHSRGIQSSIRAVWKYFRFHIFLS